MLFTEGSLLTNLLGFSDDFHVCEQASYTGKVGFTHVASTVTLVASNKSIQGTSYPT